MEYVARNLWVIAKYFYSAKFFFFTSSHRAENYLIKNVCLFSGATHFLEYMVTIINYNKFKNYMPSQQQQDWHS